MFSGIEFQPTIRLGDVITLVGFLGVGIAAFVDIKSTLRMFGFRLDILDATVEDFKKDFANSKVQDTKIERLEEEQKDARQDRTRINRELNDLRIVANYVQQGIDGEYPRQVRRKVARKRK